MVNGNITASELARFSPGEQQLETKYGLPADVRFCKRCVMSNQRPNSAVEYAHTPNSTKQTLNFNGEGICDACAFAEQKNKGINWEEREQMLKELCDRYRLDDGAYDCLVPGSGGKDSFYAAHLLKYKFGMNPLTVTWAPHMYTPWGWRNFQSWIHAGFDNLLTTPNGKVHRLLTRLAVERLFHPFQPFIIGQKALAPKLALLHNIQLVFYGENEAEYGNPISDTESALRSDRFHTASKDSDIYLAGTSVEELLQDWGVHRADLQPYLPADVDRIRDENVVVHYLGYYLKWHPQSCYYYAVEHGGFEASPERTPGTYSKYNSIDDKIDDLHYYTTFIKFGIGRATYDASQEIRSNDITREEGVALVRRFDGEFPERFIKEICEYLSVDKNEPYAALLESPTMTKESFADLANKFRSPHLWQFENGQFKLRHVVS